MHDSGQEMNNHESQYHLVTLGHKLDLATCPSLYQTKTAPFPVTFGEFIEFLRNPPPTTATKEGPGFLIGPCSPTRRDVNLPSACIGVLDADSSIDENGVAVSGAPDPDRVHEQLKAWGLAHAIFTTWSHGTGKGNRYRIVIPAKLDNKHELAALMTWLTTSLQNAGIPLALTKESCTWSQLWGLPRVADRHSPYEVYSSIGHVPKASILARAYGLTDEAGNPVRVKALSTANVLSGGSGTAWSAQYSYGCSVIDQFNYFYPTETVLTMFGYQLVGQQVAVSENDEPVVVSRYARPGKDAERAGVMVFREGFASRCYSHHINDPLHHEHALDAFEAFRILCQLSEKEALQQMVDLIQEAIASELNRDSPSLLQHGAKFKMGVLSHEEGSEAENFRFADWGSWCLLHANRPAVPVIQRDQATGDIKVVFTDFTTWWKTSVKRISYNGMIYQPHPISEPTEHMLLVSDQRVVEPHGNARKIPYFNGFPGWNIKPARGRWPLLEWHLRNAICGGSEEEYEYTLNWFAQMIQDPKNKPGVALVLRGKKGTGKSLLMSSITEKLGTIAIVLANNRLLTGNFNQHLRGKILAVVEESFWAGAHSQEGVLKHLISDGNTTFEAKGVDAATGVSYTRFSLITNERWAAPASDDERRFFIPTVTDASLLRDREGGRKGNFFPFLKRELDRGGLEAFFYDLMNRQVTLSDVVNVPETGGLREQRTLTLRGIDKWLLEILLAGEIQTRGPTFLLGDVPVQVPYEYVDGAIKDSLVFSDRYHGDGFQIRSTLTERLGSAVQFQGKVVVFGMLSECRERFVSSTKISDTVFTRYENGGASLAEPPGNVLHFRK